MRRLLALLLLCAGFDACLPPPMRLRRPTSPDHGGIVMSLRFEGEQFPYWLGHQARELFFRKVLPDGTLDPTLTPANYRAGDRLYALDLPPGRYALVAASYFTGRTRQLARFPEEWSKQWIVEVRPGELDFGGAVEVTRKFLGWGDFFWHGLRRAASYLPPFKRAVIPIDPGLARTDRSRGVELQALRLARADLGETAWGEAARAKLTAYGNPPPVIMTGRWRKKPVPPHRAKTFSWMDTLDWGPPRKVAGGLEWRRPKQPVWASVAFVPASGENARPLDRELRLLREAGAPEDRHTLEEVRVSSRSAYEALYTTYLYKETELVGSDVRVLKTEALVVPVEGGFYKLQYRASAAAFDKFRPEFSLFIRYLDLAPPVIDEDKK